MKRWKIRKEKEEKQVIGNLFRGLFDTSTVQVISVGTFLACVAAAGTFSLVRFRSVPGTAKEIGTIFLAMAAGLICGMGYLAYGILFSLVMGGFFVLYTKVGLGQRRKQEREKVIHITIPEDLYNRAVYDSCVSFERLREYGYAGAGRTGDGDRGGQSDGCG